MKRYQYLILGGGVAAGYAAQTFAAEGAPAGALCIISAEEQPPYERPPLSKEFLAGEETAADTFINERDFYAENGIELRLNNRVDAVDFERNQVHVAETDEIIGFDRLLIATGSGLRRLDIPGAELENVFYLRRLSHSRAIREAAKEAKQAVIVGGSFIAMEVTAVLRRQGLETTMIFPEERVWQAFFTPQMSAFFSKYYEEKGVTILPQTKPAQIKGDDGRVTAVITDAGQEIPADLVVMGVGVQPNVDLFQETPLQVDEGIVVNRFLETNLPGVFAAGDVARYRDVLYDKPRRVEHWDNAFAQGRHAARAMLGQRERFEHVPFFFSDVFDLSYEFWGDTSGAEQVVYRGDPTTERFSAWWLRNGRLVAAFVMGRPDEERDVAPQWIAAGKEIDPQWLAKAESLGERAS